MTLTKKIVQTLFFGIILLLFATTSFAQSNSTKESFFSYQGFSGGMFVHAGHFKSDNFTLVGYTNNETVSGLGTGLGGRFGFHFGNHFRVGCEGYSSSVKYKNNTSVYRTGWGGLLIEYLFTPIKRFKPFVGTIIGGGSYDNVTALTHNKQGSEAVFREARFMGIAPTLGIEYRFSKKLSFVLKTDYTFCISKPKEMDYTTGVRIYFGMIFNTLYKRAHINSY